MAERPLFRPRRFGHSNLFISDVHRAMDFFRDVVGLEECFQEPAIHAGFMGNGNTHHDIGLTQVSEESVLGRDGQVLVPEEFGHHPGLFHLAFEMENEAELVAAYERVVKWDVPVTMTVDHTLAKSVYLLDPEKNMLEFTADSTADWRATFREYEGRLVTGPWTPGESPPDSAAYYPVDPDIVRVEPALAHSLRTTHAVLGCRDFETQLAFYRDVGGLEDVEYSAEGQVAVLKGTADPYSLVLFQAREGEKPGYHHMAFELSQSDFEADAKRIAAAGIAIEGRVDHAAKKSVLIRDPDGLGIEFFAPLSDAPTGLSPEELRQFWVVA